jgi:hypothetical protein
MRKTFSQLLRELPKPKKLTLDERLPRIFDILWDAKTLRQLYCYSQNRLTAEHLRYLREAGYDTTNIPRSET